MEYPIDVHVHHGRNRRLAGGPQPLGEEVIQQFVVVEVGIDGELRTTEDRVGREIVVVVVDGGTGSVVTDSFHHELETLTTRDLGVRVEHEAEQR